jgi:hypothetical protein
MKLLNRPQTKLHARRNVEVLDDFFYYVTADFWTSDTSDDNDVAPAVGDAEHGQLTLSATTDDNEETGIFSTNEIALFQDDCMIVFDCLLKYSEAATSAMNLAVGMCNAPNVDNWITDNGGAIASTNSGTCIYKLDGGTVWRANTVNNSVTKDHTSIQTAGSTSWQRLEIVCYVPDGTNMEVHYFLDGLPLTDSNNKQIVSELGFASATEMNLQLYLKAGSTTTELALFDAVYYGCLRV